MFVHTQFSSDRNEVHNEIVRCKKHAIDKLTNAKQSDGKLRDPTGNCTDQFDVEKPRRCHHSNLSMSPIVQHHHPIDGAESTMKKNGNCFNNEAIAVTIDNRQ